MKDATGEGVQSQTQERYDDLIAYPEGGRGYEYEVLTLGEFAQVMKWQAKTVEHNLGILKLRIPASLKDMLALETQDLMNVQLRQQFTWGEIGNILIETGFDYLQDAYALTSANAPDERSPSE